MKKFTLKTVDIEGNLITESPLVLDSKRTVLVQHLPDDITLDEAHSLHRNLARGIESDDELRVLSVLHGTRLQVLEIE